MLTKLNMTLCFHFTQVHLYVLYVCVSEGIRVKYIWFFLKSRVSDICVKRIRIYQGVDVLVFPVDECRNIFLTKGCAGPTPWYFVTIIVLTYCEKNLF